jgi:hypothetical protein
MNETALLRSLLIRASDLGVRLFRNNVGKLQDRRGTWVAYGLHEGSPDLVGWTTIEVTPEMVGCRLAVFVGVEAKSADGRVRPAQRAFLDALARAGAVCGVVRSTDDLETLLAPWRWRQP